MAAPALTAQDRLDVMDLIARYAVCLDKGDVDGVVDVFTPDAVWDHINGPSIGHEVIRKRIGFIMDNHKVGKDPALLRHFVGLPQISGDGESCVARTYVIIFDYESEEKTHIRVPLVGSYEDQCVKVDGQWRIARRKTRGDLEVPNRVARLSPSRAPSQDLEGALNEYDLTPEAPGGLRRRPPQLHHQRWPGLGPLLPAIGRQRCAGEPARIHEVLLPGHARLLARLLVPVLRAHRTLTSVPLPTPVTRCS